MSFLQKYKKLDNLCKDLLRNDKGISAYIESMEQCSYITYKISGWDNDYKTLKNYRYIRNRIVHEDDVDESDLSDESDELWLEQFYDRILNCKDPLALYRQASEAKQQSVKEEKNPEHLNVFFPNEYQADKEDLKKTIYKKERITNTQKKYQPMPQNRKVKKTSDTNSFFGVILICIVLFIIIILFYLIVTKI